MVLVLRQLLTLSLLASFGSGDWQSTRITQYRGRHLSKVIDAENLKIRHLLLTANKYKV